MATPSKSVALPARDFYGSRLRCLLLTHQPHGAVAQLLTALVHPFAVVDANDVWMPRGFLEPGEAKLGEVASFLSEDQRRDVTRWWLAVHKNANTPNWDIASTCKIEGQRGLILVEAKAHNSELSSAGKPAGNAQNDESIRAAIAQANDGLSKLLTGWNLTADSHYQLCNRFAWSWKVASMGVPVVLVYLGFLNAEEMADHGEPFHSGGEWADAVQSHCRGVVPHSVWNHRLAANGTSMRAIMRAVDLQWKLTSGLEGV